LRRLAKALHVSVEYLTNDESADPKPAWSESSP
jgi:hypothetical protein